MTRCTKPMSWMRIACTIAAVALGAVLPVAARAQDEPATIAARLAALSPDDPMAYFTLGEDLGYAHDASPALRRLARELLLIAASIDREGGSPMGLDRSAALALADLAETEAERRWLRATAEALAIEGRSADAALLWPVDTAAVGSDDLHLRVAETLARARANDGIRVQRELARAPVQRTLLLAGVPASEVRGIMAELGIVAGTRQCPGCRNERAVRERTSDGRMVLTLCPVCGGNPGAQLSGPQYLEHLRAEALVLRVEADDWSTDLFLSNSQPLNDTGFEALLRRYGVDAGAREWEASAGDQPRREPRGRWARPPANESEAPPDPLKELEAEVREGSAG
jgi:hypothetical protein